MSPESINKPTVRFYILPEQADLNQRLLFACSLVEKAQSMNMSVYIQCADHSMLETLDDLLWCYKGANSFIPHCPLNDEMAEHSQIWLGVAPERVRTANVLIDLSFESYPLIPNDCQRIFEIVTQHEDVLTSTRSRFKYYREWSLSPQSHKIHNTAQEVQKD